MCGALADAYRAPDLAALSQTHTQTQKQTLVRTWPVYPSLVITISREKKKKLEVEVTHRSLAARACSRPKARMAGQPGLPRDLGRLEWARGMSMLVPVVAAAFVCAVLLVLAPSPEHRGAWPRVLEQTGGTGRESVAALEQQRAQLQNFLARAHGGPGTAPGLQAEGGAEQTVEAAHGKPCGKLCHTRNMILQARGRIDSQAHLELQQLAVLARAPVHACPCAPQRLSLQQGAAQRCAILWRERV